MVEKINEYDMEQRILEPMIACHKTIQDKIRILIAVLGKDTAVITTYLEMDWCVIKQGCDYWITDMEGLVRGIKQLEKRMCGMNAVDLVHTSLGQMIMFLRSASPALADNWTGS